MKAISVIFALLWISVGLRAADDPLIGTWKLDVGKSKYTPGPPPKSLTNRYDPVGENGVKSTVDTVDANGKSSRAVNTYYFDGKEHPDTDARAADTVMNKRIDAYTTERTLKKGGKVVNTLRRSVSRDGKTLIVTQKGINAQGKPFSTVQVYIKQ